MAGGHTEAVLLAYRVPRHDDKQIALARTRRDLAVSALEIQSETQNAAREPLANHTDDHAPKVEIDRAVCGGIGRFPVKVWNAAIVDDTARVGNGTTMALEDWKPRDQSARTGRELIKIEIRP